MNVLYLIGFFLNLVMVGWGNVIVVVNCWWVVIMVLFCFCCNFIIFWKVCFISWGDWILEILCVIFLEFFELWLVYGVDEVLFVNVVGINFVVLGLDVEVLIMEFVVVLIFGFCRIDLVCVFVVIGVWVVGMNILGFKVILLGNDVVIDGIIIGEKDVIVEGGFELYGSGGLCFLFNFFNVFFFVLVFIILSFNFKFFFVVFRVCFCLSIDFLVFSFVRWIFFFFLVDKWEFVFDDCLDFLLLVFFSWLVRWFLVCDIYVYIGCRYVIIFLIFLL